ncbi:E3 ubiquitin-protein ligase CHFR isoform X1 [Lepisosteus oculatus]|uniref:E3 ubiquitin-protein ligase CHFR isoform X1 n=1 Tax=Lepisosteus oculatus TaxID=7918 RepID=UPI00073FFC06|nr:PREDICTED: E3 ubiquitin-protein ligase CHFR isoform X1 [Lepisosteus oculatus]
MQNRGRGQPWGKLVKVDAGSESEILLVNKECTVGRKKGCDLSFPANKLVSGEHCKIVQDESSGEVWLEDMSTNGTVINMSKVVKRQMCPLQNGDVIYFVYRKTEPEHNVAYVYQSLPVDRPCLEGVTADITDVLYCGSLKSSGVGASTDDLSVSPTHTPPQVMQDPPQDEPQPSTSTSNLYVSGACATDLATLQPSCSEPQGDPVEDPRAAEGLRSEAYPNTEADSTGPAVSSDLKEDEETGPERKRRKTDNDDHFSLPGPGFSKAESSPKVTVNPLMEKGKTGEPKTDKMEESLTCIICQDLLHDCVSLQPCMHTFCAACYSGWMERSSLCPTCRCPVERIRKNHILNNLVEAYLLQHPEKCRSEEDLKSMDKRNKITQDMLQPKIERSFSDEEGSSDYLFELSDVDSESSDISQPFIVCRQCPGYRKDPLLVPVVSGQAHEEGGAKASGEVPSTSTNIPTAIQEYVCSPQGSHVICTCCLQPMPDRRAEYNNQQLSLQQCTVCQRPFCHMYWGCSRVGCLGCLARFSDLNLTDKCLDGVLNSNNYESDILKNYLASRGISWKEMLQESLLALQQGTFYLSDYRITANAVLCYCCGLRAFKELTYQYRQNIPAAELPAAVTSRPDCYWGRNCRTQVKAHHAMKFNHICEQTRFKN